jgi:steroid delta-isomerase-like uncharacterized protein
VDELTGPVHNGQEDIMSEQLLIDAAKAPILAYGDKNWDGVKAALAPTILYDEVAWQRKFKGIAEVLEAFRGWAAALPDSKATFHTAFVSGNTVVLELTWRGTHRGPLQLPTGPIPPTNRQIEVRACQIVELSNGKPATIRHYYDMATLLKQLGIEETVGAGGAHR